MKIKTIYLFLILAVCLISFSIKETEITGEVFIVTQGAGSYKFRLVEISVIPEKEVTPWIANLQSKEIEEVTAAKQTYDKIKHNHDVSSAAFERALAKYSQQGKDLKAFPKARIFMSS